MIRFEVNGVTQTVPSNTTLLQWIEMSKLSVKTSAVAINNIVRPKSKWESTYIAQGDAISIFTLVAGG